MQKNSGTYRQVVGMGFLMLAIILFMLGANALFLALTTIITGAASAGPVLLLFTFLEAVILLLLSVVLGIIGAARIRR